VNSGSNSITFVVHVSMYNYVQFGFMYFRSLARYMYALWICYFIYLIFIDILYIM
jgi:hypothetical protein